MGAGDPGAGETTLKVQRLNLGAFLVRGPNPSGTCGVRRATPPIANPDELLNFLLKLIQVILILFIKFYSYLITQ